MPPLVLPVNFPTARFVDAHDMTSLERDMDAEGTYFSTQYRQPGGEAQSGYPNGRWYANGGFTRDQMTPRGNIGSTFMIQDARWEIAQAKAYGIDGMFGNLMGTVQTEPNQQRALLMSQAAAEDGTFRYTPNVDLTAIGSSIPDITSMVAAMYAKGGARQVDGKYLLSSFYAEGQSPTWWSNLKTSLASAGYPVNLIAVFLDGSDTNITNYAPVCWGAGVWGPARPENVSALTAQANKAKSLGLKWLAPVRPQDFRPNQLVYAEGKNTELFRTAWANALGNGDMVQVITWDDFAEHTHVAPSVMSGYGWLKLVKLYAAAFKSRSAFTSDTSFVILSHRIHPVGATASLSGQSAFTCTLDGNGAPRDYTEALCYFLQAGSVSVNGGSSTAVPANTLTSVTAPLVIGSNNRADYTIGGGAAQSLVSNFTVTNTPNVYDYQYKLTCTPAT